MAKDARSSNGYDPEKLQEVVGKIDGCLDDLLSERGSYMAKCRVIRKGMAAVFDEAKAAGIPTKELRLKIKNREREAKIKESIAELENDEKANYDMICQGLGDFGDTELGKAAIDKARPKGSDTLDSLSR
jgi:chorismate mutase